MGERLEVPHIYLSAAKNNCWKILAGKPLPSHSGDMVTKEDLLEKFQITGCENLSDEVLQKCVELCQFYDKDEEEFVDMWVAYAIGHLDGNLEPTVKALKEMQRDTTRSKQRGHNESLEQQHAQTNKFLNTSKSDAWIDEENEILGIYASDEKFASLKHKRSPDREDNQVHSTCKIQSASHEVDTLTSATTQSTSYYSSFSSQSTQLPSSSRVLTSFGPKIDSWTNDREHKYSIRRAGPHIPPDARYMFELLKTTSDVRTRICRSLGYRINSLWAGQSDDVMVTWNVRTRHQQKYRTWGRVGFDSEIKQSNPTVLLEGCRKPPRSHSVNIKNWPQVELDVSELRECCLFPGQIIAVEGLNLTENLFKVYDMYRGIFIPESPPPKLEGDLKMIVAAGPFTQSNDLNYQPLWELMNRVVEEEPHILVLIGPFIDYNHPDVQNNAFSCTYQEFFNKIIMRIKNCIDGKCTQVILVASSRDAHHHAIYPTPEYFLPKTVQSPDIHVLPDPCTIDIDGLRIGITSIDCLMHLGRQEVVLKPSGMDKLSRLGHHILSQACFYPLYPPAKEVNIDSELWEKYAFLKEKPHMLFLPSDMRYFVKAINDSIILNPERLCKRTFAKINVASSVGGWKQDNISCEIFKM